MKYGHCYGFLVEQKPEASVVVVHNRGLFNAIGEHSIMLLFKYTEKDGENYKVDFEALERGIEKLPEPDKKQCEEIIATKKKLGFTTQAFQYGELVKMGCGHWEYLQDPYIENLKDNIQPKCPKCVCNWNRA